MVNLLSIQLKILLLNFSTRRKYRMIFRFQKNFKESIFRIFKNFELKLGSFITASYMCKTYSSATVDKIGIYSGMLFDVKFCPPGINVCSKEELTMEDCLKGQFRVSLRNFEIERFRKEDKVL